jgi:hypothetical protein
MANRVDAQSAGRKVAVTPSDTTRFVATVGLTVNVEGDVNCMLVNDTAPSVIHMLAGIWYPGRFIAVYSTSTDADLGITALYDE